MTVAEAERYMAEGHFAPGSMKPKIEACIRFLKQSAKPDAAAIITDPPNLQGEVNAAMACGELTWAIDASLYYTNVRRQT
jgi:carbamate kinase